MPRPKLVRPHLQQSNPEWVTYSAPVIQLLTTWGPQTAEQLSYKFDPAELIGLSNCLAWLETEELIAYEPATNLWQVTGKTQTAPAFCLATFLEMVSQKFNVKVATLLDPNVKVGKVVPARGFMFGELSQRYPGPVIASMLNWPLPRVKNYIERYHYAQLAKCKPEPYTPPEPYTYGGN